VIVIDHDAPWILELAWLAAFLAELGHERAAISAIIAREYLHSIIAAVDDEQETSMMVEHQASRKVEQAISTTFLPGANRELDSSITIKSIVSHLCSTSISLTQRPNRRPKLQTAIQEMKMQARTHETRDTRHETRDTKQEQSGMAATRRRTNECKRARASLFLPFTQSSEPLLGFGIGIGICIGKRS